jgi:3-oxoacyl-[acyl-carrier protein] reductase
MGSFKDKNIVIVGASSGIGKELCRNLRSKGAELFALSRVPHPDFEKEGIHFSSLDVTGRISENPPDLPQVIHGLVYCAGSIRLVPFQRLKESDFLEDFQLNVVGAVRVLQYCLRSLINSGGSSVVLLSTVAARIGMSFHASIATAKAALEGLAKSLAAEFAAKRIRVNVVSPSLTDTPLASFLLSTDDKRERAAARHPLGRIGAPSDIANAIVFLLSEESSWITGQVVSVDGGMSSVKLF